jgi:GTPase SAR1 family protein
MQLWDVSKLAIANRYIEKFFVAASCIVLLFDVTRRSTLTNIKNWVDIANKYVGKKFSKILVGNKCDLPSEIDRNEPIIIAETLEIPFFSVSAKTGFSVKEMFATLARISVEENTGVLRR